MLPILVVKQVFAGCASSGFEVLEHPRVCAGGNATDGFLSFESLLSSCLRNVL